MHRKGTAREPSWPEWGPCRPRCREKTADTDPAQAAAGGIRGIGRTGADLGLIHLDIETGIDGTGVDWSLVRWDIEMHEVVVKQQKHECPQTFGVAGGASGDPRRWCFQNFPFSLYLEFQFSLFFCIEQ